jgi:DNA-binding protein H-NS
MEAYAIKDFLMSKHFSFAKYSNPANDSETWSGRGRKPLWFVAALKSGKRPEDMMI